METRQCAQQKAILAWNRVKINGNTTTDPQTVANTIGGYFYGLSSIDALPAEFRRRIISAGGRVKDVPIPVTDIDLPINRPFLME